MVVMRAKFLIFLLILAAAFGQQQLAVAHESHDDVSAAIFELEQTKQWLMDNQPSEGFVYAEAGITSVFDSTAQALTTSFSSSDSEFLDSETGLLWLEENASNALNNVSWRVRLGAINGDEQSALITELVSFQHDDGGFGSLPGSDSSPLETAFALLALGAADFDDGVVVGRAVAYLVEIQNDDGSFFIGDASQDSLWVTSLVIQSLQKYTSVYDVSSCLKSAVDYLYSLQDEEGHWMSNWESAQALLAVVPFTTDASQYIDSVLDLHNNKLLDGSWDGDVYTTALVHQAVDLLLNFELPTDLESGVISGNVTDEITLQAIQGLNIDVQPSLDVVVTIEGNGDFRITGLGSEVYLITMTAPGYLSLNQSIEIDEGQLIHVGLIRMKLAPSTGLLSGVVTDRSSGLPISGAAISAAQSNGVLEQVSDDLGFYDLILAPGDIGLTASAEGYISVQANATVAAGEKLTFNPMLEKALPSSISGLLIDSETNAPLNNATLTLVGSGVTTQSGVDGRFFFDNAPIGETTIDISIEGYNSRTASFFLPENHVFDIGTIQLVSVDNGALLSSILGVVVDSSSAEPLPGVDVIVMGINVRTLSGVDGAFMLEELFPGALEISFEKEGFVARTVQLNLEENSAVDFGVVELTPLSEGPSSIAGVILDSTTSNPVGEVVVTLQGAGSILSNVDGSFLFEDVALGNTVIEFEKEGYVGMQASFALPANTSFNFGTIELIKTDEGILLSSISGSVVNGETAEPLSGVDVTVVGVNARALSGVDGGFNIDSLLPGNLEVSFVKEGFETLIAIVAVSEDANLDFGNVELIPSEATPLSASIVGSVVDSATGESIEGVEVSNPDSGETVFTGLDGSFTLEGLALGTTSILFSKENYVVISETILLIDGTVSDVGVVQLQANVISDTTTVKGRVIDADTGLAIDGANITVANLNTLTNSNGEFSVSGIEELSFVVGATSAGYTYGSSLVTLDEPTSLLINLQLMRTEIGGVVVSGTQTENANYGAFESVLITTEIENISIQEKSVRLFVEVKDSNNQVIDYFPATNLPLISEFDDADAWQHYQEHYQEALEVLAPLETRSIALDMRWSTQKHPPGNYLVSVQALDGESSRLLSQLSSVVVIDPTQNVVSLVVTSTPDYALIGSDNNLEFSASLVNRSNIPLDIEIDFELLTPANVQIVSNQQTIHLEVDEGEKFVSFGNFPYQFMENGEYPILLNILSGPIPLNLEGRTIFVPPNVRIEMTQELSTYRVVPEENVLIEQYIELKGISGE